MIIITFITVVINIIIIRHGSNWHAGPARARQASQVLCMRGPLGQALALLLPPAVSGAKDGEWLSLEAGEHLRFV